jgi:hypothetical protein
MKTKAITFITATVLVFSLLALSVYAVRVSMSDTLPGKPADDSLVSASFGMAVVGNYQACVDTGNPCASGTVPCLATSPNGPCQTLGAPCTANNANCPNCTGPDNFTCSGPTITQICSESTQTCCTTSCQCVNTSPTGGCSCFKGMNTLQVGVRLICSVQ